MAVDLLDTPLRLTWDFPAESDLSGPCLSEIASRIGEAGVFSVTLQGVPLLHQECRLVLEALREQGCQVTIDCRGSSRELSMLAGFAGLVDRVLFDVADFVDQQSGPDRNGISQVVKAISKAGHEPVLSLVPLGHNLRFIPEILGLCRFFGVARFKLPNASIGDSFRVYSDADLPRWQDLERFRELWSEHRGQLPELPELEIHDLFLWEIMTPGREQARSEYGGCQAANSLAHVDGHGIVHPCSAWPEPLGSLLDDPLDEIWQSAARYRIREEISQIPDGCHGCCEWSVCRGGCRGLATALNPENGARDLMCRERRQPLHDD